MACFAIERIRDDDDDDGILKVSRREHHCLMALALAAQLSTAVA
jgi:hypothetical protein